MIKNFNDHAANERTYLSWIRTALGIAGFGIAIPRLDLAPGLFGLIAGFALVVVGSVILVLSTVRFVTATREIEASEVFSANSVRREVILSGLLLASIVVFSILLWFAARQPMPGVTQ
jgi:putative membrane protein